MNWFLTADDLRKKEKYSLRAMKNLKNTRIDNVEPETWSNFWSNIYTKSVKFLPCFELQLSIWTKIGHKKFNSIEKFW